MPRSFADILDDVSTERDRQDALHGGRSNMWSTWVVILGEEMGEVARAILERDTEALYRECIQVVAVTVAIHETDIFAETTRDEVEQLIARQCDLIRPHRRALFGNTLPWWFRLAQHQLGQWAAESGAITALNIVAASCVHMIEVAESGNAEWR